MAGAVEVEPLDDLAVIRPQREQGGVNTLFQRIVHPGDFGGAGDVGKSGVFGAALELAPDFLRMLPCHLCQPIPQMFLALHRLQFRGRGQHDGLDDFVRRRFVAVMEGDGHAEDPPMIAVI